MNDKLCLRKTIKQVQLEIYNILIVSQNYITNANKKKRPVLIYFHLCKKNKRVKLEICTTFVSFIE